MKALGGHGYALSRLSKSAEEGFEGLTIIIIIL